MFFIHFFLGDKYKCILPISKRVSNRAEVTMADGLTEGELSGSAAFASASLYVCLSLQLISKMT